MFTAQHLEKVMNMLISVFISWQISNSVTVVLVLFGMGVCLFSMDFTSSAV